ncbi:hypothetical protein [Novosphingobium naphthalenivorans]|uniref:hypothetical protein n=1 Tax=Novosphingobium naphthalenivorans TaxID=273168 RepID=UPI00082C06AE|nr:hypothetical protein [Novosphingobium naphthalenivorans]
MFARSAKTQPAQQPERRAVRSTLARTKLDWAIIVSLLAMGAFSLMAVADHFGATTAYAAAPVCGVPLA